MIKMPLVKIEIRKGKSKEYKKAILEGVHRALVDSLGIPEHDRFQRIYELNEDDFEAPNDQTDAVTIIQITLFPGRSFKAKKKLYSDIVHNLSHDPGIDGHDILIVLLEPPMENWGIRGGKPASDVDLGFKIDI
jgi:phenylpyruvate tautomerase PptA (4-oxalocrotonate tautomerase family)